MTPDGRRLDSTVNQERLAPWIQKDLNQLEVYSSQDNVDYSPLEGDNVKEFGFLDSVVQVRDQPQDICSPKMSPGTFFPGFWGF
jgi:hypothetical protein